MVIRKVQTYLLGSGRLVHHKENPQNGNIQLEARVGLGPETLVRIELCWIPNFSVFDVNAFHSENIS